MPSVNNGPSVSTTTVQGSQLGLSGIYTYRTLPAAASVSSGTVAYTSDAGTVQSNGVTWLSSRRARGNVVALLGDSITDANFNATAGDLYQESTGYLTWFNALSGQALICPQRWNVNNTKLEVNYNFAVGGFHVDEVVAILPAVLAARPDWAIVMIGTNDIVSTTTELSTITSGLQTIYDTLWSAGINVVAIPILARTTFSTLSGASLTAARQKLWAVNRWIKRYASTSGRIIVADPNNYLVDPASATGDVIDGYLREDGLHPGPKCGYYVGLALYNTLKELLPQFNQPDFSAQTDIYDATNNPTGNIVVNGMMNGTTGVATSPVTGEVATSWTINRASGSTITAVASKETRTVGGVSIPVQRFVVSTAGSGAASEVLRLRQDGIAIPSGVVAGDLLQAECELTISSQTGTVIGTYLALLDVGTAVVRGKDLDRYAAPDYMPNVDSTLLLRTPPIRRQASTTTFRFNVDVEIDCTSAGGVTLDVSKCSLRKVTSP